MTRLALATAVGLALAAPAPAADPPPVDRSPPSKEPAYKTKAPRYGLLAFGPAARDRVWLVLDGDTLYVDRNGNGDLTEPGEKVAANQEPGRDPEEDGYGFDAGEVTVGGRTHKGLLVSFLRLKRYDGSELGRRPDAKAALAKDPKAMAAVVTIDAEVAGMKGGGIGGRVSFMAGPVDLTGVFKFAVRPADAPVVVAGGPLEVTFYGDLPAPRVGRECEFVLVVGTPGVGPGTFAMVRYEDTIPEDAKPVAEVTYQPAKPGDPPVKEKYEVKGRC
jgi:hypothetical protein